MELGRGVPLITSVHQARGGLGLKVGNEVERLVKKGFVEGSREFLSAGWYLRRITVVGLFLWVVYLVIKYCSRACFGDHIP